MSEQRTTDLEVEERSRTCGECGMLLESIAEYHPFAACLMYRGCRDSITVRANLSAVVAHGYEQAYDQNPPVRQEDVR